MARLASNSSQPFSVGYQPSYEAPSLVRQTVSFPAATPVSKAKAAVVCALIGGLAGAVFGFVSCALGGLVGHFLLGVPFTNVLSGAVAGGIIAMAGNFLLVIRKQLNASHVIAGSLVMAILGGVFCALAGGGTTLLGISWWLAWPVSGLVLGTVAGSFLGALCVD